MESVMKSLRCVRPIYSMMQLKYYADNPAIQLFHYVSYLFKLQFRVDPHIADLTVEGSFLSIGVHWPRSLLSTRLWAQARICFDRAQPTPGFKNSFVFGTCRWGETQ